METHTTIITAAGIIIGVQAGLFAWLKADIGALTGRVEREVAFIRGPELSCPPAACRREPDPRARHNDTVALPKPRPPWQGRRIPPDPGDPSRARPLGNSAYRERL